MEPIVQLKNISKKYEMGEVTINALTDVNTSFLPGEFVSIAGPSGSGKSTLLNLIGYIDTPSQGDVLFENISIKNYNDDEQSELRNRKIGFIFQNFNLIPVLNIYENIELPLLFRNESVNKKQRQELINELIEQVGLTEYAKHRPTQLSGGQQQRVSIARALITAPKLVLADEPTANLDSETSNKIMELMLKLNIENKTTFVFSTHDPLVMNFAKRIIKLKDGMIIEDK